MAHFISVSALHTVNFVKHPSQINLMYSTLAQIKLTHIPLSYRFLLELNSSLILESGGGGAALLAL